MLRKSPGLLALLVAGAWLFAAREVSAQPIGVIDQPTGGQTVSGVVKVTGWVLDFNQLDKVICKKNPNYAIGDSLTIADLTIANFVKWFQSGKSFYYFCFSEKFR